MTPAGASQWEPAFAFAQLVAPNPWESPPAFLPLQTSISNAGHFRAAEYIEQNTPPSDFACKHRPRYALPCSCADKRVILPSSRPPIATRASLLAGHWGSSAIQGSSAFVSHRRPRPSRRLGSQPLMCGVTSKWTWKGSNSRRCTYSPVMDTRV